MSKLQARFSFMNRIEARQDRRLEIAKGNGNWREFILAIFLCLSRWTSSLGQPSWGSSPSIKRVIMKSQGRGKIVRRYQRGYVIILLSSLTPVTSYESPNYECMQDNLHTWRPGTVAQYGNTILCCFPVTSTGAPGSLSSDVLSIKKNFLNYCLSLCLVYLS